MGDNKKTKVEKGKRKVNGAAGNWAKNTGKSPDDLEIDEQKDS